MGTTLANWMKSVAPALGVILAVNAAVAGVDGKEHDMQKSLITAAQIQTPPVIDGELTDAARRQGREVWWYTAFGPNKPHANLLLEYPAIDPRMLMGFMAYAHAVDGFLYYSMIRDHNNEKILIGGPYTDWNPKSYGNNHGDGHQFYPGRNGPVTSIRMENWLDGMEDYEYLALLERRIEELKAAGKKGRAERLEAELAPYTRPGNDVVTSMSKYTLDPDVIEATRRKLAGLILEAVSD